MKVAIEETDRRRGDPGRATTSEHGIEPTTIVKGIRDINDRLRAVAENTIVYSSERRAAQLAAADKAEVEQLVARMEAEMRSAAKELEFERAAAHPRRDPADPAPRAGAGRVGRRWRGPRERAGARTRGCRPRSGRAAHRPGGRRSRSTRARSLEVTEVTVLPGGRGARTATATDAGGHGPRTAVPRDPRRARRRRRLAGPLARPARPGTAR